MERLIKKILKFKIVSGVFAASLIFVVGGTLWAYSALHGVSGPLILHFNNLAGINQIGGLSELLWIGVTAIVVVVVNFFIALELEARDWFLGKLLAAGTMLLGILTFIGFASIISVN